MKQRLKRYERLTVDGLRLKARGLPFQEICGELRARRDTLLRAFAMPEEQGWDGKVREGKLAGKCRDPIEWFGAERPSSAAAVAE